MLPWLARRYAAAVEVPSPTSKGEGVEFSQSDRATLVELIRNKPMARFSSHLLYDNKGSDLYEKITSTPEYYIARAEHEVIDQHLQNFADFSTEERHVLIELGSGVGEKTHEMLPVLKKASPKGFLYAPLDFDQWALDQNRERLAKLHPDIECQTVRGLFEEALPTAMQLTGRKTILFQGSTFGNFKSNAEATAFLKMVGDLMSPGDRFVIGVDTAPIPGKKSADFVHDGYRKNTNGWRDEFMLNALDHGNRRCGLDFDRSQWKRLTEWDNEELCVFHYYEATAECEVHTVPEGQLVRSFKQGERILVQTHYKFTPAGLTEMGGRAGVDLSRVYMSASEHFMWAEFTVSDKHR